MKRTGFKQRDKPLSRSAIKSKRKPVKAVSAKKAAYRRSDEGKAALAYMGAVKQLPCVVCGAYGVDAHHCRHMPDKDEKHPYKQLPCAGRKSHGMDTIPLCPPCHTTGPNAIHREKAKWRERHGPDYGYIEKTRADVARALG